MCWQARCRCNDRNSFLTRRTSCYVGLTSFKFRTFVDWIPTTRCNFFIIFKFEITQILTTDDRWHTEHLFPVFTEEGLQLPVPSDILKNYRKCNHVLCLQNTRQYDKCWPLQFCSLFMMTSSNGNIFRITGHLCGEFTGPRWIPRTKASDTEL